MKLLYPTLSLSFLVAAGLLVLAACSSSVGIPSPTPQPSPTLSAPSPTQGPAPEPARSPSPSPTRTSPPMPTSSPEEQPPSPIETPAPTPAPTQPQPSPPAPAVTDAVAPVRSTDCDAYADFATDVEDPSLGYVQLEYPKLTVELIDRSAGNITRWEWDFDGDGVTDLDYSRPPTAPLRWGYPIVNATYDVTLRVTDGQGCTDTLTKESYIRVSGCPE